MQATYSSSNSGYSHSRQSSSEHLHVDTGPAQLRPSFSQGGSGGLSADPTSLSSGGSPYTGGFSATSPMAPSPMGPSPMGQQYSQSPQFEGFTSSMNMPRSPAPMGINRPMSSAGSRPASSMSNRPRPSSVQNGPGYSFTSFTDTSMRPTSPPQQPDAAFDGVRVRAMGPSPAQGDFDSDGIRIHATGRANEVPEIRVTGMNAPQEQFSSSFPFPSNSFQQPTPMAAPRPTSANARAEMKFRMSGPASGRATPQAQYQPTPIDLSSPEGRRMVRENMRQDPFGSTARSGAFGSAAEFSGAEFRSASRMSSRGMMSGGMSGSPRMSGGGTFASGEHSGFTGFTPTGFSQVSVVE